MTKTEEIKALKEKIKLLEGDIKAVENRKEEMTPERELAIALHGALCHCNHTDGCGWYWVEGNIDMWEHSSRRSYVDAAQKILNDGISLGTALRMITHIKDL